VNDAPLVTGMAGRFTVTILDVLEVGVTVLAAEWD
jgi:hypothetical protein